MVQRFQDAGIECIEWRHGEVNPATVVIVSADIAVSLGFLSYARLLCKKKLLRRIFLDEGHLTFTSSDWRPKLAQLKVLRSLDCPMVLLSATIPPILEIKLADCMLIHNARYIRCSTVRPHHRYHVQNCRRGELQAQTLQLCRRLGASFVSNQKKGVIYCRTRATCEVMATELGCAHYHAGVIDRAERLEQWSERGGWIVATGALGTGVDFPGILVVVHMGMPYSMINFTQESGRAGRGDEVVDSFVVIEERWVEDKMAMERASMSVDEMAMGSFLTSVRCRRAVMSRYLDGTATSCSDIPGGARCDRCGEGVTAWQEWEQKISSGWEIVTQALDEMAVGCVACLMMEADHSGSEHTLQQCVRHSTTVQEAGLDRFREVIRWQDNSHSCHRCGLSQKICATGEEVQMACQWPGVMIPVLKVAAT
jgi:superfamily II DNA helicase RecQ